MDRRSSCASSWLGRSHVRVFAFLFVNIVMRGQLCQQLVRPVARTCFCFSAGKNRNTGAVMPASGIPAALSGRSHILVFAFPLVKIIIQGQLCQQLVRPVAHTCFRFFACKNRNASSYASSRYASSRSSRSHVRVFAFSLVKIITRGQLCQQQGMQEAVSGRSHVPVFAFSLVKIITRGQLC